MPDLEESFAFGSAKLICSTIKKLCLTLMLLRDWQSKICKLHSFHFQLNIRISHQARHGLNVGRSAQSSSARSTPCCCVSYASSQHICQLHH